MSITQAQLIEENANVFGRRVSLEQLLCLEIGQHRSNQQDQRHDQRTMTGSTPDCTARISAPATT
jgi:hypothetical protein